MTHAVLIPEQTPARILSDTLIDVRAELRETQARLRDAERELALLRGVLAERTESVVRLASGAALDLDRHTVSRDGRTARFTAGEWRLLAYLLGQGRPVDRAEIETALHGGACCASLVATMMTRVRIRLEAVGSRDDLLSWGYGKQDAWYDVQVVREAQP